MKFGELPSITSVDSRLESAVRGSVSCHVENLTPVSVVPTPGRTYSGVKPGMPSSDPMCSGSGGSIL